MGDIHITDADMERLFSFVFEATNATCDDFVNQKEQIQACLVKSLDTYVTLQTTRSEYIASVQTNLDGLDMSDILSHARHMPTSRWIVRYLIPIFEPLLPLVDAGRWVKHPKYDREFVQKVSQWIPLYYSDTTLPTNSEIVRAIQESLRRTNGSSKSSDTSSTSSSSNSSSDSSSTSSDDGGGGCCRHKRQRHRYRIG